MLLVPSIRVKGIAVSLVKLFVLYSIPYAALRLVGCTALNFAQAQMLASLRRLAQIEGDYTVYPGHMNSTTLAREKAMNPYLRHALR